MRCQGEIFVALDDPARKEPPANRMSQRERRAVDRTEIYPPRGLNGIGFWPKVPEVNRRQEVNVPKPGRVPRAPGFVLEGHREAVPSFKRDWDAISEDDF